MGVPYAEVIGDPISHSKSPLIHKFWLEKLGIEADYRATRVTASELADYFAARRADPSWMGCNVTLPHKEAVVAKLDTVTRDAGRIGAVNTVRHDKDGRLHGRNSDVHGILRALDSLNFEYDRVVLIGAGGAARAAAFAISKHLSPKFFLVNRTAEKSARLIEDFRLNGELVPFGPLPAAELIINASALGMTGQPALPVSLENQFPRSTVFDMVYAPYETALLRAARGLGLETIDGLTMLINQAHEAFGVFFARLFPKDFNVRLHDAELRELLTQ